MRDAALFTVVYPTAEKYLPDFLHSIEQQTCTDFDLVIGNDGLGSLEVDSRHFNVRIIELSGTPAENREEGLRFLRDQGYEQAIFGDCDDYFSANRVEVSLRLLREYEVVVNDLDLVGSDGRMLQSGYLSRRLRDGEMIEADFIRDKNIFGLSNTAARVSCLSRCRIPADLPAVDWFVFATSLEGGARGIFSSETRTSYRQHSANVAGFCELNPEKILQSVEVKARHYSALAEAGLEWCRKPAEAFRGLQERLKDDKDFRGRYLRFVKLNAKEFAFWWENTPLLENRR